MEEDYRMEDDVDYDAIDVLEAIDADYQADGRVYEEYEDGIIAMLI